MKLLSVAGRKRACNPSALVTELHTYIYSNSTKFSYADWLIEMNLR